MFGGLSPQSWINWFAKPFQCISVGQVYWKIIVYHGTVVTSHHCIGNKLLLHTHSPGNQIKLECDWFCVPFLPIMAGICFWPGENVRLPMGSRCLLCPQGGHLLCSRHRMAAHQPTINTKLQSQFRVKTPECWHIHWQTDTLKNSTRSIYCKRTVLPQSNSQQYCAARIWQSCLTDVCLASRPDCAKLFQILIHILVRV